MSTKSRLVIATRNEGKAAEIRTLFGDTPFELLSLSIFKEAGEAPETEDSYEGNATSKARYYAASTGEFVLADDSGLEVVALNGAPGVLSARYAGPTASDSERRLKLLDEIARAQAADRSARFVCALALASKTAEIIKVTHGICAGSICLEPRGNSGFGYDPIFIPKDHEQTFGELAEPVKNRISHRAKAIVLMRRFLLAEDWSA